MKKKLTLMILVLITKTLFSQDIIMLKNGDEIKAKVTDINN